MSATIQQFLSRHAPFDAFEPAALEFMVSAVERRIFPAGSRLAAPALGIASHLYIVAEGRVRASDAPAVDGESWEIGEGECFPIGALSGRRPPANSYEAASEVVCYLLSANDFHKLMEISNVFARYCGNYLSTLLGESQRNLQARFSQMSADQQSMDTELRQLIKRSPIAVGGDTPLRQALETMARNGIGSIIVVDDDRRPAGIFTQSDVLTRVVLREKSLSDPIATVMSARPMTLPESAHIYDAMFAMADRGVRHVLVVDPDGRLAGVVSERDLFALQRVGIGQIRRAIESAVDVAAINRALKDVRQFAFNMLAQGIGSEQLTRFISAFNDAVTRRVIEINLKAHTLADIDWAWLAFGSEGREEQTLSTDQDNGIVFVCPPGAEPGPLRERLLAFARAVNADLDRCGYPLCKGNIMASNPEWCLTLDEWRKRFAKWIRSPEPKALLNATIFFDFRALWGNAGLAAQMHQHLFAMSRDDMAFQKMLAANALTVVPPLGLFRDFATETEDGGEPFIDLKKSGARLFVDVARVYSLAQGIDEANTVARLRTAGARESRNEDNEAIIEAFNFIQLLRLRHQDLEAGQGRPGDNRIEPEKLNQLDRRILKEAFRQARNLQQRLKLKYQA
ncbi:MAG: CBS domain-containing protein [Gammaproteobacteria bacterium]|nr:CBS domain-containing protein [Gammaproteobacteria bacterium]MBU1646908.1 CBS domain-containing protein [Gammaproteobacteria bacterium]MBU1971169.1 CBS domain-containing protein [Gammaproteobacteria bacterium]